MALARRRRCSRWSGPSNPFPRPQPTTPAIYPQWVHKLRELPPGAVIDTTYKNELSPHLYYATGHGHPVGEGYISRYPKSVDVRRGAFRHWSTAGTSTAAGRMEVPVPGDPSRE